MAKCGEADPRWIVEERADAHNVNNWHWRERDATDWSKKKLTSLLKGLKIEDGATGSCFIDSITSCDGEASVSNRKKKIICFYDFEIKAKWKGSLKNSGITYIGQMDIPNLSEENDVDEVDISIYFGKDDRKCEELKELMRKKGSLVIRERLQEFMTALRTECASSIQVPTNDSDEGKINGTALPKSVKKEITKPSNKPKTDNVGTKIPTKKLVMSETFMTSVEELFKTLTLKDRVAAWSRSQVDSDVTSGVQFALFDNNVSGLYRSVILNEKIEMKWRFKTWPDGHHSCVTLTFKQTSRGAKVELEQTGVPENSIEATKNGWKNYYWQSIKMTFGYGAQIF